MKKRILSVLLGIAFTVSSFGTVPALARDYDFDDVPASHWAYATIMQLSDENVIDGFEDNTFNPDGEVTREQFVKLLVCAVNDENADAVTYDISDIDGRWSYPYISAAEESSIIGEEDLTDGGFDPQGLMNRATAVKWISKSLNVSGGEIQTGIFNDITNAETDNYASELYGYGIISGYEDGGFHPDSTLTRAEAAAIIKNIMGYLAEWEIPDEEKEIIEYADGVLALEGGRKTNILTKNSTEECEFSNIDDDIKSLKEGDVVVLPNCKLARGGMAVKVKRISVKGKTAVITKDSSMTLDEVVTKIDINKKEAITADSIVTDELPEGVTVTSNNSYARIDTGMREDMMTASLMEMPDYSFHHDSDGGFYISFSQPLDLGDGISVAGGIDVAGIVHTTVQYDEYSGIFPTVISDISVDAKPNIKVTSKKKIDDIRIFKLPFDIPLEMCTINGDLIFEVGLSGEVSVIVAYEIVHSGTMKCSPTLEHMLPEYRTYKNEGTPKLELEAAAIITPKVTLRAGISVLGIDAESSLLSVYAEPEVGVDIRVAINSGAQNHVHQPCLDIGFTPYLTVGVGASVCGVPYDVWDVPKPLKFNTLKHYAGYADKWEFGKGICPYLKPQPMEYTLEEMKLKFRKTDNFNVDDDGLWCRIEDGELENTSIDIFAQKPGKKDMTIKSNEMYINSPQDMIEFKTQALLDANGMEFEYTDYYSAGEEIIGHNISAVTLYDKWHREGEFIFDPTSYGVNKLYSFVSGDKIILVDCRSWGYTEQDDFTDRQKEFFSAVLDSLQIIE